MMQEQALGRLMRLWIFALAVLFFALALQGCAAIAGPTPCKKIVWGGDTTYENLLLKNSQGAVVDTIPVRTIWNWRRKCVQFAD